MLAGPRYRQSKRFQRIIRRFEGLDRHRDVGSGLTTTSLRGDVMGKKRNVYGPRKNKAAEWLFVPSAAVRKAHPDAPGDEIGMDLQDGEVMSLDVVNSATRDGVVVLTIVQGRLELKNYAKDWQELNEAPDDAVVWDIARLIETWSSDD